MNDWLKNAAASRRQADKTLDDAERACEQFRQRAEPLWHTIVRAVEETVAKYNTLVGRNVVAVRPIAFETGSLKRGISILPEEYRADSISIHWENWGWREITRGYNTSIHPRRELVPSLHLYVSEDGRFLSTDASKSKWTSNEDEIARLLVGDYLTLISK